MAKEKLLIEANFTVFFRYIPLLIGRPALFRAYESSGRSSATAFAICLPLGTHA